MVIRWAVGGAGALVVALGLVEVLSLSSFPDLSSAKAANAAASAATTRTMRPFRDMLELPPRDGTCSGECRSLTQEVSGGARPARLRASTEAAGPAGRQRGRGTTPGRARRPV